MKMCQYQIDMYYNYVMLCEYFKINPINDDTNAWEKHYYELDCEYLREGCLQAVIEDPVINNQLTIIS